VTTTFDVPVEAGKVAEFQRAVGAAGRTDVALTFLTVADGFWAPPTPHFAGADEIGFDLDRCLHAEQDYRFPHRQPRVGEVLQARRVFEGIRERSSSRGTLRFGTMATTFSDSAGAVVAEQRVTLVELPWVGSAATRTQALPSSSTLVRTFGPLTLTDFVRYAGASGDFTAAHFDSAEATRLQLDGVIAQGMLLAGFLATTAAELAPAACVRRFSVRFCEPVQLGATVACHVVDREQGEGSLELRMALVLDDRSVAAWAELSCVPAVP
jgi:acyl dehydratase